MADDVATECRDVGAGLAPASPGRAAARISWTTAWVPKPGITPQEWKLRQALVDVRLARHHLDCRCASYRRDGAPYCTMREYAASIELDKLIGGALCVIPSRAG